MTRYVCNAPPEIRHRLTAGRDAYRRMKRLGWSEWMKIADSLLAAREETERLAGVETHFRAGAAYSTIHQAVVKELGLDHLHRSDVSKLIEVYTNCEIIEQWARSLGPGEWERISTHHPSGIWREWKAAEKAKIIGKEPERRNVTADLDWELEGLRRDVAERDRRIAISRTPSPAFRGLPTP